MLCSDWIIDTFRKYYELFTISWIIHPSYSCPRFKGPCLLMNYSTQSLFIILKNTKVLKELWIIQNPKGLIHKHSILHQSKPFKLTHEYSAACYYIQFTWSVAEPLGSNDVLEFSVCAVQCFSDSNRLDVLTVAAVVRFWWLPVQSITCKEQQTVGNSLIIKDARSDFQSICPENLDLNFKKLFS